MTEQEQAAEFWRRRNLVGTTVRYMHGKRYSTICLSRLGTDLGERTEFLKRGKVVSTLYSLPKVTI